MIECEGFVLNVRELSSQIALKESPRSFRALEDRQKSPRVELDPMRLLACC